MSFRKFQKLETTKVFLRASDSTNVYQLVVTPDGVSWGQTFTERTYATKTVENQGFLRDDGVFKKANPASFSFTSPLTKENHAAKQVFDLLVGTPSNTLKTFTLWFIDADKSICLETCIITSGSIVVQPGQAIALSIEGQAGKQSVFKSSTSTDVTNIITDSAVDFGTINSSSLAPVFAHSNRVAESARTILTLDRVVVEYSSTSINSDLGHISNRILSFSVEVQNKIKWIPHQTLHGAISTTGRSNIEYPTNFVLEKQSIAGNITTVAPPSGTVANQGIPTDATDGGNNENQQFVENSDFKFGIFGKGGTATSASTGTDFGITFTPTANCVNVTKTIEVGPFWTASHNWRVNGNNTSALSSILTYTTA